MGGRYEVRFEDKKQLDGYMSTYTNSWFEFMKLRLIKKVIYYKVFIS